MIDYGENSSELAKNLISYYSKFWGYKVNNISKEQMEFEIKNTLPKNTTIPFPLPCYA